MSHCSYLKHATSLTFLLLAVVGCGGESIEDSRTRAEGRVEFNGRPLPGGSITLISAADPQFRATAMIRPNGTFSVANAPRGTVRIAVETESLQFGAPSESYVAIPDRYMTIDRSELSAEIGESTEPLLISLQP